MSFNRSAIAALQDFVRIRAREGSVRFVVAVFTLDLLLFARNFACSWRQHVSSGASILFVGLQANSCALLALEAFEIPRADCLQMLPKALFDGRPNDVYRNAAAAKQVLFAFVAMALESEPAELILFSDVDVALLADPFDSLLSSAGMSFMHSGFGPGYPSACDAARVWRGGESDRPYVNTGFYYVRPGAAQTEVMLKACENLLSGNTYDGGDQGAMQQAVDDIGFFHEVLSCRWYGNSRLLHDPEAMRGLRAFHANWIRAAETKRFCLQMAGMWSVSATTCMRLMPQSVATHQESGSSVIAMCAPRNVTAAT